MIRRKGGGESFFQVLYLGCLQSVAHTKGGSSHLIDLNQKWVFHPAIPLLGIYPRDTLIHNKDICTTMFMAALFIIARSWKEPRCPSEDEWIQKLWYIYTMEYYSAIRNNDFMKFLKKWMHLENIILSEVTQSQKNRHNMQSLII